VWIADEQRPEGIAPKGDAWVAKAAAEAAAAEEENLHVSTVLWDHLPPPNVVLSRQERLNAQHAALEVDEFSAVNLILYREAFSCFTAPLRRLRVGSSARQKG
jgi:hypothetical protein